MARRDAHTHNIHNKHIYNTMNNKRKNTGHCASPLEAYKQQVAHYPLLTAQEEQSLALRIAQNDAEALHQLVQSNLRLVVSLACAFTTRPDRVMDLVGEGNVGLVLAARRYTARPLGEDGERVRFATYATWWIRRQMLRFIAAEHRRHLVEQCEAEAPDTQLDEPTTEPSSSDLLQQLLRTLPPRQREVLVLQFGLEGEPLSLVEAARRMGITPQRAGQLARRGMRRIHFFNS